MKGRDDQGEETEEILKESDAEKDLGVIIDKELNFKNHIAQATKTADNIVGIIRRTFDYLDQDLFTQLFKSLVRPRLEYGHLIWNPNLKYLQREIEAVQRNATRLIPSLREKSYPKRLEALDLPSLYHRRLRGDLIEVFKYMNQAYDVEYPRFKTAEGKSKDTRGHSMKLAKQQHYRGKDNSHRNKFLTERVFEDWNSLPEEIVKAPSVNAFKNRLDKHWRNRPDKFSPPCL